VFRMGVVGVLLVLLVFGACAPTSTQEPPAPVEVSFEIEPNSSHFIPVYLEEGQWLRVHYLYSPTNLGADFMWVKYTYPGQQEVSVDGPGGSPRKSDFETVPHGEGYYSINFYYIIDVFQSILNDDLEGPIKNILVYVRYEILSE
jgi:hypothetical protein